MLKKSFLIFFSLFVFLFGFSQKAVYQLPVISESSITNPTFFYTLPKTAFKVEVVVTKVTNMKGLYADFATKLLGINNYCKENTTSYRLKNITITPYSVPDETLQFVVELSTMQVKNNFLQTLYTDNSSSCFRSFSTLEQNHTDILPEFFKNYAEVTMQHFYETYTETKIIDGIVTQVPVTQTKVTTKTLEQQAREAVDFIEKIRKDRYTILSFEQETTLSKDAFEYLVNQLNELEKKYLELFTGITVFEDAQETFVVYPKTDNDFTPVCSVSPSAGFSKSMCRTDDYNYYLHFEPQLPITFQKHFKDVQKGSNDNKKGRGYCIRKAVPVLISLYRGAEIESVQGIFPVYQFGILEVLPPNLDSFEIGKWGYIY